jgi:hypothetical protein
MTIQAVPRTGQDKIARHDFDKTRPSYSLDWLGLTSLIIFGASTRLSRPLKEKEISALEVANKSIGGQVGYGRGSWIGDTITCG